MEEIERLYQVCVPNTAIGAGAAKNIGTIASEMRAKKALIVAGPKILAAGSIKTIETSLKQQGIAFSIFDKCKLDAPSNVIEACANLVRETSCDLIIAVGGGSTLDTAKLASVIAYDTLGLRDIIGAEKVTKPGLLKILVPTTAGSGSEWSRSAVFLDTVDGLKKVVFSKYLYADRVILDPLFSLNMPAGLTAETGMDALSHAIEGYTTWKSNVISNMFAETCIKLVAENLRIAFAKGSKHLEARYNMALAASLGIQAIMTAAGGMVHALSYPIAAKTGISHGAAISVMLPVVMDFNLLGSPAKYARIAELMGEDVHGLSEIEKAQRSVRAVTHLSQDVGMPQRLRDMGIEKDHFPSMIDFLFEFQEYAMENNPRDLRREDVLKLLETAW